MQAALKLTITEPEEDPISMSGYFEGDIMLETEDELIQLIHVSGEKEEGKRGTGGGGGREKGGRKTKVKKRRKEYLMITCGFIEFLSCIQIHFCALPSLLIRLNLYLHEFLRWFYGFRGRRTRFLYYCLEKHTNHRYGLGKKSW